MCVSYRTDRPIQSETEHEKFCHRKIQNPSVYLALFFRADFSVFIPMFCCLRVFFSPLAACVYICCWGWWCWCWWCGISIVSIFRSYVFASFFETIDRINIQIWFIISHRLRFQGARASLCVVATAAIGKLIHSKWGQLKDATSTFLHRPNFNHFFSTYLDMESYICSCHGCLMWLLFDK